MNNIERRLVGKVIPTPKGTWSAGKIYDKLDFVLYQGSGYVSMKPTDDKRPTNDKYWYPVNMRNKFSETKDYYKDDVVYCENETCFNYYIKNITDTLPNNTDYWTLVTVKGDWVSNRIYDVCDVVRYRGVYYMSVISSFGLAPDVNKEWVEIDNKGSYLKHVIYKEFDMVNYDGVYYYKKPINKDNWYSTTHAGNYRFGLEYNKFDVVTYHADEYTTEYYMCIKSHKNVKIDDTEYWKKLDDNNLYSKHVSYQIGDVVKYINNYYCKKENEELKNPLIWTEVVMRYDWTDDEIYHVDDIAMYSGKRDEHGKLLKDKENETCFICIQTTKSYSPLNDDNWTKICEKGEQGQKGEPGLGVPTYMGVFDEFVVYHKLDVVLYKGSSYVCITNEITGISPDEVFYYPSKMNIKPVVEEINDEEQEEENTIEHVKYWQLICKGLDYTISPNGEVVFHDAKVTGVKTYTDNVYEKDINNEGDTTEPALKEIIAKLQVRIKYCEDILKKYQLD